MHEKDAWKFLRTPAGKYPHDRIQRIENVTADGMPDINGCIGGVEFWIELKCPRMPKRESTPIFGSGHPIMPNQFAWANKQRIAGGNSFYLICFDEETILLDGWKTHPDCLKMNKKELIQISCYHADLRIDKCWEMVRLTIYTIGINRMNEKIGND